MCFDDYINVVEVILGVDLDSTSDTEVAISDIDIFRVNLEIVLDVFDLIKDCWERGEIHTVISIDQSWSLIFLNI